MSGGNQSANYIADRNARSPGFDDMVKKAVSEKDRQFNMARDALAGMDDDKLSALAAVLPPAHRAMKSYMELKHTSMRSALRHREAAQSIILIKLCAL